MNKLHSMTSVAALLALSVTGTAAQAADNQPASASSVQSSKAKDGQCGEAKRVMMKKSTQHKIVQHKKAADASCGGHKAGDASCGSNH
ncbi:hypothetical protein E0H77_07045 [Acinetobacter sp. ANC 4633]|uniref:hypothetical protein n=1 Tax=Acinetobacter sp. ANC 4633 TaxID=2529845 RepID=UPI00103EAF55|nr:hypothetical protein [Acinetobacter sp. ANC 4633]TCB26430.1 hypothetical protein E0H77_07045 [Acinetobacter sp. ANC 4633]